MMILLEDYAVFLNTLKYEKGGRIILYNKQDAEKLKKSYNAVPYLDILSDQILIVGMNELEYIIKVGIPL